MKTIYKKLLFLFLLLPLSIFAQSKISGVVLDAGSNQPMPGVNVIVRGASNSTTTDFDGKFQLNGLKKGDVIEVSFIGYKTETVSYSGQSSVTVTLSEEANQLQEVVVQVGYGSVKKKDATGSVATVTAKDFNKGAIVSADQLLTGKVAGVRITNSGGQPDAAPNIRIRGGASINASNNPLIVIDGVPVDSNNPAGVSNPFNLINPNDIESFTVLKDASATAIYGARASNGVIIITTKKGTSGDIQFNYSANVTAGKVGKMIDVMNASQFTKFIQEFHPTQTNLLGVDDLNTLATDDLATSDVIEGRILSNTDWQSEIYRTSISTDHNFSARANIFNDVPFRASIGYNNTQGLVKTSDYNRLTASVRLTPTYFDKHLKVDFNVKGIHSKKNAVDEGGSIGGVVNMDPTKPVYDNSPGNRFGGYYQNLKFDGTSPNNGKYLLDGQWNPLAILEQRTRPERVYRLLGNIELDYKFHFLPDLRLYNNFGLDASRAVISENYSDNSIATYRFDSSNNDPNTNYLFNPGRNYYEAQRITNTTWDTYLMYSKTLDGFLNKFDLQAGYSYQNFKNDGHRELYQYNNATGLRELAYDPSRPNNGYFSELNLQSYFGRTNIDLAKKYLFTFSLRADASSLFSKSVTRWGYFPAAALAWKLKEESFLKNVSMVNDIKIRLGWGKTGQQNITDAVGFYPSTPLFTAGNNSSQYLSGYNLYAADPFNKDVTWEKATTYNAGIDFDFFKNSFLSGSFDIYRREITDLLAVVPLPPGQGLTNQFIKNVGSTESKGFELNLNFKPLKTDKANLEVNTNLAYNYSEITSLDNLSRISAGGALGIQTGVGIAYHAVGFQPYSAWVFQQVYNQDGSPIEGAYVDRNGDNVISNDDRYYKAFRPNWTFGFGLTFNYGNWDFSSNFRGQYGGQVYNQRKMSFGYIEKALPNNTNSLSNVLNGTGTYAFDFVNNNGNIPFSDYYLEDATFVRCENIVLGYKFPKFIKSSSLRVYGALNNPFIITKYKGQDPENFDSIDSNFYPRPRMYTFGLSLDF